MSKRALQNPGAPIALSLAGLDLVAFSISGLATYVLARGLDACFDLGHCDLEGAKLQHVFLSHVHQDHAGGVHRHLSLRAMLGVAGSRIYCPRESAEALRAMLRAWSALEGQEPPALDEIVRAIAPGDRVALGRRTYVEVFEVRHRIASVGFTVVERQRALRPEWVGRAGPEIAAAVASGVEVHAERDRRRLTYVGDSTIETFALNPALSDCDVLFMEATHLPGTPVERVRRWGHTHLDELVALYARDPAMLRAKHIVLKHFSVMYSPDDIAAAHRSLPEGLRERVVMLA